MVAAEIELGNISDRRKDDGVVDEESKLTLLDRVQEKLEQTLPQLGSIDQEDLFRLGVSFKLALSNFLLYGVLLAYFVYSGTVSEMSKKFLSVQAPDPTQAICASVPVPVTGTYQADTRGAWSSDATFDPQLPIYELEMTGSTVDLPGYSAAMANFSAQLQAVGDKSRTLDVLSSQMLWTLYRTAPNDAAQMRLRAYADVKQSFLSLKAPPAPVLASRKGTCEAQLSAAYGYSTLVLSTSFPSSARPTAMPSQRPTMTRSPSLPPSPPGPVADDDGGFSYGYEPCPDQVHLNRALAEDKKKVFGVADSTSLSFDLDLRSAATAYLLNFGIIDVSALTVYREGNDGAGHYRVTYVSLNYPEMQPVECHTFPSKPRVCLAAAGSAGTGTFSYVYPVLSTSTWPGTFEASPGRLCTCPQDQEDYFCNTGQYGQLTLAFSSTGTEMDTITMGWKLQQKIEANPGGASEVRALIAGLGTTSIYVRRMISLSSYVNWMKGRTVMDKTVTPPKLVPLQTFKQYRDGFDGLGKNMSLLVYELERLWGAKVNLNAQGVALTNFATTNVNASSLLLLKPTPLVMCQDTLFQAAALGAMAATPPVSVEQPYLSCSATPRSAFVTAAGIAAGNASLISTAFISLAVFFIVLYNNMKCGRKRKTWFKVLAPARKAVHIKAVDRREKKALAEENERLAAQVKTLQSQSHDLAAALSAQASHACQMRDALAALGLKGLPSAPSVGALHIPRPISPSLTLSYPERLSSHALPHGHAHVGSPVLASDVCGDNPMYRTSGRPHA